MRILKVEYHRPDLSYRPMTAAGHCHEHHELIVIRSGGYRGLTGPGLTEPVRARAGQAVLWAAGTPHRLVDTDDGTSWHYIAWTGGDDLAVDGVHDDSDRRLLTMAVWLFELDGPADGEERRALLSTLLLEIRRTRAGAAGTEAPELRRARRYLRDHCGIHTAVSDCAAFMDISVRQFERLFHRTYGLSPRDYVTQVRLERTLTLLQAGHGSTAEVAQEVGFSSSSALCQFVRKHTGTTPGNIRRASPAEA